MIDHNLLDILVCPETKQPLRVADESVLEAVNASIVAGSMSNRGGEVVTVAVTEGLIREDGDVLYPVRDDIPIMLIDESIPLPTQA
ncbi:MAG: Trm112 family protein [Longimicrobiales bacterium]